VKNVCLIEPNWGGMKDTNHEYVRLVLSPFRSTFSAPSPMSSKWNFHGRMHSLTHFIESHRGNCIARRVWCYGGDTLFYFPSSWDLFEPIIDIFYLEVCTLRFS
jgi:hypothetical protein